MKILKKLLNAVKGMILFIFIVNVFYLLISIGCNQIVSVVPYSFIGQTELEQTVRQFICNCIVGYIVSIAVQFAKDVKYSDKGLKCDFFKMFCFLVSITIIPILIFGLNTINYKTSSILIVSTLITIIEILSMIIGYYIVKNINKKSIEDINKKLRENK